MVIIESYSISRVSCYAKLRIRSYGVRATTIDSWVDVLLFWDLGLPSFDSGSHGSSLTVGVWICQVHLHADQYRVLVWGMSTPHHMGMQRSIGMLHSRLGSHNRNREDHNMP
jgi:hypothetical protein